MNTKKYIEQEIINLKNKKEKLILNVNDNLHEYSIAKRETKFSFGKKTVDQKIDSKKIKMKNKIKRINIHYKKSIDNLNNKKDKNYYFIYLTKYFRRLGFGKICNSALNFLNENKLMLLILSISIIVGFIKPVFFSKYNILNNVLKNNVTIGIMAIGMTFTIITGGIDLSVGSILGFTGLFSMGLILNGFNTILAFMIGFLIASLLGIVQGFLISHIKLPPFIVTLVGLLTIRGVSYIYAKGQPKTDINNSAFQFINNSEFIGIPFLVWILFIFTIIGMFVLKYTIFGRNVYAVGGNEEASKLSGINTKRIIMICYLISGLMAGISSLAFVSKISSAGPTSGNSYELDVIAAVVLGGTSLSGGKGGIGRTFLGWLVISVLTNALNVLGYDSNWQLVFKGIVILIVVIFDKNLKIFDKLKKIHNKIF